MAGTLKEVTAEVDVPPPYEEPKTMSSFALVTRNDHFRPTFTWKIEHLAKRSRSNKFTLTSPSLKTTQTGCERVEAEAELAALENSDKIEVTLFLEHLRPYIKPQIFYLIRDRSGAREPQHVCVSTRRSFFSSAILNVYEVQNKDGARMFRLTHPAYNVDDSVVIDFYVETPLMTHSYVQCEKGTFSYFIDHFRQRIQMEGEGLIGGQESPYFYTGRPGYRVQLKFILNGTRESRGEGPAVEVSLLQGQWDGALPRSYAHRMTLTLLNRKNPGASVGQVVERVVPVKKRYCVVGLCSNQQMESLIENDTLYYDVIFEQKLQKYP